jgi:stage II sporulation protein D
MLAAALVALALSSSPSAAREERSPAAAREVKRAPLTVRLLERDHPRELELEVIEARCGERTFGGRLRARASTATVSLQVLGAATEEGGRPRRGPERGSREVAVSECQLAQTAAGFTLHTPRGPRAYRGRLQLRARDGVLVLFNQLDPEDYLRAVTGAESPVAPAAALEAQAIVSRTYAEGSRGRHAAAGYDLCDLTHCQLYPGRSAERPETDAAVARTRGQLLWSGGELRPTHFHAACGGSTSSARDVFGEAATSPGVADEGCGEGWEWSVRRAELARALALSERGAAFRPLKRDPGGRVIALESFGRRLSGNTFHARVGRAFGWQTLRGMRFSATESQGHVTFTGQGLGHGVGLCQQGAARRAERGESAGAILHHYFPGGEVK